MGIFLKVITGNYAIRAKRDRRMADSRRLVRAKGPFAGRRVYRRVSSERRRGWRRISRWSSSEITSGFMDSLVFNYFPER